jgi:hypothetical protein
MNYQTPLGATLTNLILAITWFSLAVPAAGQSAGTPSASSTTATGQPRAAYLIRGDEVQARYNTHRLALDRFYQKVVPTFDSAAPDLKSKLLPPADIPFGYQILPAILADPANQTKQTRIRLSPFSWSRTDSIITREADSLVLLESRFDKASSLPPDTRHAEYAAVADQYRQLVYGQRFIADLIQYNRLWQSEIARLPADYANAKRLQNAALTRQAILDTLARTQSAPGIVLKAHLDSLSTMLRSAIEKGPTPSYVRVSHPSEHQWIVTVPVVTDITDSAFVENLRNTIETRWHVVDNGDDFSVKVDLKRIAPSELYPNGPIPAKGAHIEIAKHLDRFPKDAAIITTGSNSTYVFGRAVMLGPHAFPRRTIVHEFGHLLGFKDDYFRSYEDSGPDGYRVLEVILPPDLFLATPEYGRATREHFEKLIGEIKQ